MNLPNFTPDAPGAINLRTFQDLRRFLIEYIVNRWMQYTNNWLGNELVPLINSQQYGFGPAVASASTITPTALVQQISGTAAIDNITPMPTASGQQSGPFYAIARDGFSTTTGGNISQAISVAPGHMAIFAYDLALQKWGVVTS